MSLKKIVTIASILAISVIMLFVYPSTANSTDNQNSAKTVQAGIALTNLHSISVSSNDVLVHYFGKDIVEKTMKQPGCVGVRMYYGKHADGRSGFIFVGIDKYGKDLAPVVIAGPTTYCPPLCRD
jgi:hypothetical protein